MPNEKRIRIANIFPDIYTDFLKNAAKERERLAQEVYKETNGLVELKTIFVDKGLASIESVFDEAINTPFVLEKVKYAAEQGYDAITIDCCGDPGLDAAKESVDIPVLGACESSIHIASIIGKRFSIINILPETEFLLRNLVRKYGLETNLASIKTINIPVLELEKNIQKTAEVASAAAEKAVRDDRAFVIVLGCTGMAGLAEKIEGYLKSKGLKVPVIDPLRAEVYLAISMVLMNIAQSKEAFRTPREKPRRIPPDLLKI